MSVTSTLFVRLLAGFFFFYKFLLGFITQNSRSGIFPQIPKIPILGISFSNNPIPAKPQPIYFQLTPLIWGVKT